MITSLSSPAARTLACARSLSLFPFNKRHQLRETSSPTEYPERLSVPPASLLAPELVSSSFDIPISAGLCARKSEKRHSLSRSLARSSTLIFSFPKSALSPKKKKKTSGSRDSYSASLPKTTELFSPASFPDDDLSSSAPSLSFLYRKEGR